MNPEHIHYGAVVVAALATFVLGGLWYSPLLFGKVWMRANGFTEAQVEGFSKARMFGWSLMFSLVMSMNLAMFLADEGTDWVWGMTAGALAGVGWVSMAIGVVALFENRSWSYILVNAGYQSVAFTLMGMIIGAWR
jgi:hypothetical protein